MRKILVSAALAVASGAFAQVNVVGNTGATWSIDPNGSLVWNGTPYQPVGLRIAGTLGAIEAASQAGVKDVLIELSVDGPSWKPVIDAAEAKGLRYLITISSMAPICEGIAVEPETYRIPGIKTKKFIEFPMEADWALSALVYTRDAVINSVEKVEVRSGFFNQTVDPKGSNDNLLLIYPHTRQQRMPDFWTAFDGYRDKLLKQIIGSGVGKGFRGIINPLGETVNFPQNSIRFIPTDPVFRTELEAYLSRKYSSVSTAIKNWQVSTGDFETFAEMSRLVPLWSESRGIPQAWDPQRNTFYPADAKRSVAWRDIQEVIRSAARRRYARLVDAIRMVTNVPVIQDWRGWNGPYADIECRLSGMGVRVTNSKLFELADEVTRPSLAAQRWATPGWVIATHVSPAEAEFVMGDAMRQGSTMGIKGWFVSQTQPQAGELLKDALATDTGVSRFRVTPYPEAANNPAAPVMLPNGGWWAPAPGDGNRIDYGSRFEGYRYSDGDQTKFFAIWGKETRRVKLYVDDVKDVTFETVDGSDPKPKIIKKQIEVTIGTLPLIIKGLSNPPVPEPSIGLALDQWEGLKQATSKGFTIISEEANTVQDAIASFDRSPGAAYVQMREALNRLNKLIAPYVWIEGEAAKDHTFSEIETVWGCSGNRAIHLMTRLPSDLYDMQATYSFSTKLEGEHKVWIAAKIPAGDAKFLLVQVGDQSFRINQKPVSNYCDGYGWYELGTVNLQRNENQKVAVKALGAKQIDVSVDAIMLTPDSFVPEGPRAPNVLPEAQAKKK